MLLLSAPISDDFSQLNFMQKTQEKEVHGARLCPALKYL
jgi:hypothetical protein